MKGIITLLRPQQWVKNLFVFLPLFFNGGIANIGDLTTLVAAFFSFSFIASSIYCLNDIKDAEADRLHPKKCKRPIASGAVSIPQAIATMLGCIAISIVALLPLQNFINTMAIVAIYFLLNIAYCLKLKRIAIVDVFVIASGFVLRLAAGGVAVGIELSHWIVMMTFLLALFLAFAKRRDDVLIYEEKGIRMRESIANYNSTFLNQVITLLSAVTIVCYIMYTVSDDVISRINSPYLYATSAFVVLGIIRYLQLSIVEKNSGSPTKILLKDKIIISCVALWTLSFILILYF